jgi:hypothetical protein
MTPESLENNIDLTDSDNNSELSDVAPMSETDAYLQDEPQAPQLEDPTDADEEDDSESGSRNERPLIQSTNNADLVQGSVTAQMIENLWLYFNPEARSDTKNDESKDVVSLFESSEPTGLEDDENPFNGSFEFIEDFKRKRILVLGGSADRNSLRVSHQIARLLKIEDQEKNIRRLDLSFYAKNPPTVQAISPERKVSKNEVLHDALVFVDAINDGGYNFTGSLLESNAGFIGQYSSKLKNSKLYMLCLINADSINEWKKNGQPINSTHWIIPPKKDEIQSYENETDISFKIEQLLKPSSETDGLIVRIILFIVAFFSKLTTREFNDLVGRWLKNFEVTEVTNESSAKSGQESKISTNTSLAEIWKAKSNFFTTQCFLEQKKEKDEGDKRVVNFYNESYATLIKTRLENHYWAFVDERVSELLRMRLIFHPSDTIANQSAAILAEYLPGNEKTFIDWLLWAFNILNNEENRAENIRQILGIRDSDGDFEETGKKYFYYNRLAKLFRAVLRYSSLKTTVSNIMKRLIQDGCHKSAFILVKRLQYDPNFDESHWLGQLLARGDADTKKEIKKYLFNGLINTDTNDALDRLKEWLPQEYSSSGKYSEMNKAALEVLVRYYSYQVNVFDKEFYGLEPTRFPLFIFKSNRSAREHLDLLVKYFLHPLNLRLRLDRTPYIYYAAYLLERWSRILCGNNLSARPAANNSETLTNKEVLNILLEKVVSTCSAKDQEKIESVWRKLINAQDALFLTDLIEFFNAKQWQASVNLTVQV